MGLWVGEVVGADDTGTDSLLAKETTDWPGHRRQRSQSDVPVGESQTAGGSQPFSGQLFSSRPEARNPQDGRRGTRSVG